MVACYAVYHIPRNNARYGNPFRVTVTIHIDTTFGSSAKFAPCDRFDFYRRLDAHIVIAGNQSFDRLRAIVPKYNTAIALHLAQVFDGHLVIVV